jgi:hypothetical protein
MQFMTVSFGANSRRPVSLGVGELVVDLGVG